MNARGRPSSKVDNSNRRDPSAFEYVAAKYSQSPVSFTSTMKRKKKLQVYQSTSQSSQSYINSFPWELKPYISLVKDVTNDGNCGFQAIANLIGIGEDQWLHIKKDLIGELGLCRKDYNILDGILFIMWMSYCVFYHISTIT